MSNECIQKKLILENKNNKEINKVEEKINDLKLLLNKENLNQENTKILSKEKYISFINLINSMDIDIINYIHNINISAIKIIINGFIDYQFNDNNLETIILEIIKKIINIYFNKNIFYFIYGFLSDLFRNHEQLNDINSINKFEKIFNIWKLLYDIKNNSINFNKTSVIEFFYDMNEDNNNISIEFIEFNNIYRYTIEIRFITSQLQNLYKFNDKFSFLKLYDDKKSYLEFKYEDIFNKENESDNINFYTLYNIKFILARSTATIYINEKQKKIKIKDIKCNLSKIWKMEILNNFRGKVSFITILREFTKENLKCEIINSNNKTDLNISFNEKIIDNKTNRFINYKGKIFSNKVRDNIIRRIKLDLSNIRYFGGFECFIPLFKIINYILIELGNIIKKGENLGNNINTINNGKNEYYNYINKSFTWIKEIIEIKIKMICLSGSNYKNFLDIIVPLIGSLSEIFHTINNLASLKIISNNDISSLFNDEVFFILYIIILNTNLPNNIKIAFKSILEIDLKKFNFSMKAIILDIYRHEIKDLDWYFSFLFNFVVFVMLYFDIEYNNIKILIEQITTISKFKKEQKEINEDDLNMILGMEPFIYFLKNFNLKEFSKRFDSLKQNKYYIKYIINIIKSFLNAKKELLNKNLGINQSNFFNLMNEFVEFHSFIKEKEKPTETNFKIKINSTMKQLIIHKFKYYYENFDFLQKIFPFLIREDCIFQNELLMEEIIDYHSQYHHLMKELFIFNRLWSNQNLFFKSSLKEIKEESKIKYKNINYYTNNYQKPIIYPILDYKYRYPEFSLFKIDDTFYVVPDNKDDYNFEIFCPELDKFTEKYNKDIQNEIHEYKINTYYFPNICLIKSSYHIKGNLIFINNINNKIIYFISHDSEDNSTCNNSHLDEKTNGKKNCLCYGSLFNCPKKDKNRIIKIYFNEIRFILKRIYFYRNSAIEIFTQTKSYYFNFSSQENLENFFSHIEILCAKSYFPIIIKDKLIGFKKINPKIFEKLDFSKFSQKKNNFIEFISNNSNQRELCEMCVFDILILINLISNRSFIDLNQYPVFPLLYFYDIKNDNSIIERDFNKHIGFQAQTEKSKERISLYRQSFELKQDEIEEEEIEIEENAYYFNTHYSNIIYVCNYLIRIFPYSFYAIELQGDGFDNPNRLFFSIETNFYNILTQKSDVREIIPEFFYFPEMFMNINYLNFHYKSDNTLVDNVIIPNNLTKNSTFNNKIGKMQENYFIFVESLKNHLEAFRKNLNNWINIIFGTKQRFNEKKEQYFRTESYIDLDNEEYKKYINDYNKMSSVEFGLTPLKTIFDSKTFPYQKIDLYEKLDKEIENEFVNKRKYSINQNKKADDYLTKFELSPNYFNNKYKDYWEENININFRIYNNEDNGELRVYKNDILISEINDHNDKLIDFFYNRRLNMFATSSYDGFICVYIIPNKLISMIKNPNNSYFSKIFLSSNPFPSIIAFDQNEKILFSYSLSGLLIKKIILLETFSEFSIFPLFNVYGGTFKDRIIIYSKEGHFEIMNVPFFNINKKCD